MSFKNFWSDVLAILSFVFMIITPVFFFSFFVYMGVTGMEPIAIFYTAPYCISGLFLVGTMMGVIHFYMLREKIKKN